MYGVDPHRLGVFGGSSGGQLALLLGTTGDSGDPSAADAVLRESSRVAAVVANSPLLLVIPLALRLLTSRSNAHSLHALSGLLQFEHPNIAGGFDIFVDDLIRRPHRISNERIQLGVIC